MFLSLVCTTLVALAPRATNTELSIPFEKYVLESNGLEVILSQDHDLPIVSVNLWYHAGPINEAPGRTGFSNTAFPEIPF